MKTKPIIPLFTLTCVLITHLTFGASYTLSSAKIVTPSTEKGFIPTYVEFDPGIPYYNGMFTDLMENLFQFKTNFDARLLSTEKSHGESIFRYQQIYNRVPVENTMYTFTVRNGKVTMLTGKWLEKDGSLTRITTTPRVKVEDARKVALAEVGARIYMWDDAAEEAALKDLLNDPDASYFPAGELVIVSEDGKLNPSTLKLAFKFDVYSQLPADRFIIYIDATTGVLIKKRRIWETTLASGNTAYCGNKQFETIWDNTAYILKDVTSGQGIQTFNMNNSQDVGSATDFTNATTNWNGNDAYALNAHYGAEQTYAYYMAKFGRNSIDNNGYELRNYVHFGVNYNNAGWDGYVMKYGDGDGNTTTPLTTVDITGHEISHGLTTYTANLIYEDESGALNEGFSDIFGTCIEFFSTCSPDWQMGEDIGSPFRDMSNPNAYGHPDTYEGSNWHNGNSDNGGVHTNSGVLNFWFYLLANGGSGTNDNNDNYNVSGIGIDDAAQIAYRTLSVYLTPSSDYHNFANAVIQATKDLYGCSSNQIIQCGNALYAVGLGEEFTGNDYDNSFNWTNYDVHFYHFVSGESFIAIKNQGILLKVAGTGGTGYNMNALTCSGCSYDDVPGYNYLLGTQCFNSAITSLEYIDGYTMVGLMDGRIAKINGTGGSGQNMFAIEEAGCGFQSVPGYNYLVGSANFSGAVTQMYNTGGETFVTFNNGKMLKVNGTGGSGCNLFAVNETSNGFDPINGYNYYVGDAKFFGSVTALKKIGGNMLFAFDNGKILKINNTGGTGDNMFALSEGSTGWSTIPGYNYYVGDAHFSGEVLTFAYDGSYTMMGFGGGKILKVNGNGGTGHNMFAVTETSGGFDGMSGYNYYVGDAKYSGHIYNIYFADGYCFVGTSNGKILKATGSGGTGHNLFNASEGSHYFYTTSGGYTAYLAGSADLGSAVLDIDFVNNTMIFCTLNGKMLKVDHTGGSGENMFAVNQEHNGYNGLPGYCYYIGSQTFDCSYLRMQHSISGDSDPVSGIKVYPNPASSEVSVDFTLKEQGDVKLEMVDFTGKIVSSGKYSNTSEGNNNISFSVKNLKSGFYTIRLSGDGINETQKLVIVQ